MQRRKVAAVMERIEQKGINFVAMKMLMVTPDLSKKHYAEHVEKSFYPSLEEFITSSPCIAMIAEGVDIIRVMRQLVGATNCREALPGTIRGDLGISRQQNLVHASDSLESAEREISLYFEDHEICNFATTLQTWQYAKAGE